MPDAIVIGAGPNGLAAAIRLAEEGRSVVVLEAQEQPGGAVRTEELTLPGFAHDTFSSVHPAGAASPVFERMSLERHGMEWVHPEACMAHPFGDKPAAVLYRELDRTVENLEGLGRGEGERWRSWVEPYLDAYPALRKTMLSGYPPVGGPLHMLRSAGPLKTLGFGALLPRAAKDFAAGLFETSQVRAWLLGSAMHTDAPAFRRGSAVAAAYLQILGHAVGWPSPRGGSGALSGALVSYLEELGGEMRTGQEVVEIGADGDGVTGVTTAAGDAFAARTVVADVLPAALVAMAGDRLSGWYRAALRRYRRGPATLKLDWALDGPIPWMDPSVGTAGTVHVGDDEDALIDAQRVGEERFPDAPFMLLGQQSLADPGRAPEGKHTAWAYTHAPHDIDWGAAAVERYSELMEDRIEHYAPGFRDKVLARHVLAPDELQRRDANLDHGDVGGGSYALDQLLFRPLPALNPYGTPIDGLFLGSAATFPGGAVHGVCGDAAARAALRHANGVIGARRLLPKRFS